MGLYIHIPFCTGKCFYCDFYSITPQSTSQVDDYITAIDCEMKLIKRRFFRDKVARIETIYIGGGTPTVLTVRQLKSLFEVIESNFDFTSVVEFTFETNPETTIKDKIKILKEAGVNRISMGVQSFNDRLLGLIGRRHRVRDVFRAYEVIREYFCNVNLDIIFALPEERVVDLEGDLNELTSLSPEHISAYELMWDDKTELSKIYSPDSVSEQTVLEMHKLVHSRLTSAGFEHYEISNFAKEGFRCKHNLKYWRYEEYIGIGPSAGGFIGTLRYKNVSNIDDYLRRIRGGILPMIVEERLSPEKRAREFAMLALRTADGIDKKNFIDKTGIDPFELFEEQIDKFCNLGLLKVIDDRIFLTEQGFVLSNEVLSEFI